MGYHIRYGPKEFGRPERIRWQAMAAILGSWALLWTLVHSPAGEMFRQAVNLEGEAWYESAVELAGRLLALS